MSSGSDSQTDEVARPRRDLLLGRDDAIATRGREPWKVPQAGPSLAGLAVSQDNPIATANDDGDFDHVLVDRPLCRPRNLRNQIPLIRLAERRNGTAVALGRSWRTDFTAELHQRLIEGPALPLWQNRLGHRPQMPLTRGRAHFALIRC